MAHLGHPRRWSARLWLCRPRRVAPGTFGRSPWGSGRRRGRPWRAGQRSRSGGCSAGTAPLPRRRHWNRRPRPRGARQWAAKGGLRGAGRRGRRDRGRQLSGSRAGQGAWPGGSTTWGGCIAGGRSVTSRKHLRGKEKHRRWVGKSPQVGGASLVGEGVQRRWEEHREGEARQAGGKHSSWVVASLGSAAGGGSRGKAGRYRWAGSP